MRTSGRSPRPAAGVAALAALTTALAMLAVGCTDGPSAPTDFTPSAQLSVATRTSGESDRHIIVLRVGHTASAVANHVRSLGGTVVRQHESAGILITRGLSDNAVQALSVHADVASVARDHLRRWIPEMHVRRITTLPKGMTAPKNNAPPGGSPSSGSRWEPGGGDDDQSHTFFYPFQWNLRAIRANSVWQLSDSHGKGAIVCDLDTGVDPTHVELTGKIDLGISTSFVTTEPDILDHHFHGTYVSAIMATNGRNMGSVAPDARLCQIKVLDASGMGFDTDIIAGLVYAADAHVDVANMSLGGFLDMTNPNDKAILDAYNRAADYAHAHGVTLVAAAGNDGIDIGTLSHFHLVEVPAQVNHVIGVGATAPDALAPGTEYLPATYTNFGFPGTAIFAPGGDIRGPEDANGEDLVLSACSSFADPKVLGFSCADHKTYIVGDGTSAASPHVAAEAAIVKADLGPATTPTTVRHCILTGTDRVYSFTVPDPITGFGFEDVLGGRDCRHII